MYNGQLEERLGELLRSGLCVTINSDDPAYFGGYLNSNFAYLVETQNISAEQIRDLVAAGFEASFLPAEHKRAHIKRVHSVYEQVLAGQL